MILATGFVIGITTLGFLLIASMVKGMTIYMAFILAAGFNIFQWIIAPYTIKAIFHLKPVKETNYNWLKDTVSEISKQSDISPPKNVYVSQSNIPNAFAFGNLFTGKGVALTVPLLENLSRKEIEGVIAHEIGHIKNHDVEIMMFLSFLPSVFYLLSRMFFFRSYWGGGRGRGRGISVLIGILGLLLYFITGLGLRAVSRVRETLADNNGKKVVGGRSLAKALTKLHILSKEQRSSTQVRQVRTGNNMALSFKTLFISDPDSSEPLPGRNIEEAMQQLVEKEPSLGEKILNLFASHPLLHSRLKNLLS